MLIVRLIIIAALFAVMPWLDANAATMISKDEANAYYGQCMKSPDARMSADTKNEFCACTAAHMMQTMSTSDVKIMQQNDSAGRVMKNKMMITVQGPCLSAPVSDLHFSQCESDPRVVLANQNIDRGIVCGCMATKVGEWLEQSGSDVMTQVIEENPFVTDPIQGVMESAVYKKEEYEIMLDCLENSLNRR